MTIHHTISDKQCDCKLCGTTNTLERVPSIINLYKKAAAEKAEPGNIVKEHIENIREEIEDMKENFKHNRAEDE